MIFQKQFKGLAFLALITASVFVLTQPVSAQFAVPNINESPEPEEELTALATPRETVRGLLLSLADPEENPLADNFISRPTADLDAASISRALDLFPRLANSYGVIRPASLVSNKPEGLEEPDLPSDMEKVGEFKVDGKKIPLLLRRVIVRNGEKQWLVSRQTIKAIAAINIDISQPLIERMFSEDLNQKKFRGSPASHWLVIPFLLVLAVALTLGVRRFVFFLIAKYAKGQEETQKYQIITSVVTPVCMLLGVFAFYTTEVNIGLSILVRQDMSKLTITIIWMSFFTLLWSLINNLSRQGERVLREQNRVAGLSLIIFFRAIVKTIIILIAVILILDNYGFDVTTGLAALGLGGIALALGAQKAIENIVGSIIIVIDQPFRVGDFCKAGSLLGTVEHIGLRSTRFRTLSDTLVTFPNGELSTIDIENFTMRQKFLLRTTLNLRYETTTQNLEAVLTKLRALLTEDKHVSKDGMRVNFIAYGAASKDVEVFAYIWARDFAQFLERQEKVLLAMTSIVEDNGSGFAFPSQTLYLSRDKSPDASPEKDMTHSGENI